MECCQRLRVRCSALLLLVVLFLHESFAFLPPVPASSSSIRAYRSMPEARSSPLLQRQHLPASSTLTVPGRRGSTALYGLFGLGTPELVVIAVVAAVVLGPDKIVGLARGVGKAAGELKAVPQEFEKGLKTGEETAKKVKASKAKPGEGEKTEVDA